jgi:hypothetical protein
MVVIIKVIKVEYTHLLKRKFDIITTCGLIGDGGFCMTFKKAFHIGYIVFVVILALIYFIVPHEHSWIGIFILSILFGIYQIIVGIKLKQK